MLRSKIRERLQRWHDWLVPPPSPVPDKRLWQDYLRDLLWLVVKTVFIWFLRSLIWMAAPASKKK